MLDSMNLRKVKTARYEVYSALLPPTTKTTHFLIDNFLEKKICKTSQEVTRNIPLRSLSFLKQAPRNSSTTKHTSYFVNKKEKKLFLKNYI